MPTGPSHPSRPSLLTLAREGLLVRPGEGARVALLFTLLLVASAIFVMGRTVRDTLFLSRFPIDALPWMFVAYGVASALTVVVYAQVADRLPRERMIVAWSALGVLTYVGTWLSVREGWRWIYPVFYVWSEVFANLLISQFWTLANDVFDARSAKRLFGTVGAARVLGIILVGLATGVVVRAIGTEQLLFVLSGLLAIAAGLALRLGREVRAAPRAKPTRRPRRPPPSILRDRYVRALGVMLLLGFASLTVGDYQFKAIARETYTEDALAAFFAYFYAGAGVLAFVFQLVATPRILRRFGVGVGMGVMPGVFGAASGLLLLVPTLPIAAAMKFADNGFQYTIHETTLQSLYVPFPAAAKARTRAFLDAVAKPLAYALGGVLLLLFVRPLGTVGLSWIAVAATVGWLAVIPIVRRRYVERLEATLRVHGLEDEGAGVVLDAYARGVIATALASEDPRRVVAALDALGEAVTPDEASPALERLARHEDPTVRATALRRLASLASGPTRERAPDAELVDDPSPMVRAAACELLARRAREDSVASLAARLDDPAREVRAAALAALLGHAGFEGAMVAGPRLAELLASERDDDRCDAARAVGALGPGGHLRLRALLTDPSAAVRRAATHAAISVQHPSLLTSLVARLGERATAGDAAVALGALGAEALPELLARLDAPETPRDIRLALPRVLRRVVDARCYEALLERVDTPDSHLRLRLFAAASRLHEALHRPPEPRERVLAWVRRERLLTERLARSYAVARDEVGTALLDESVSFRATRGLRRILRILELRHPPDSLRLVRAHLGELPGFGARATPSTQRTNALEVLDGLLEPPLRALVMPFVDDGPTAGAPISGAEPLPLDAWLVEEARHPNPFAAFAVLEALAARAHPLAAACGEVGAAHADPVVREAAARALALGVSTETLRALTTDAAPNVVHAARCALEHRSGDPMESTLEKLLTLRAAPLFAGLQPEDLLPLARVATVERFEAGEVLFEEGEPGDVLYLVASGTVRVAHKGVALAELGVGEALGEMSVLDGAPRSASATAGPEGARVLCVEQEAFYEVMREQVELAEGLVRVLSRRLREANESLEAATRPEGRKSWS